MELGPKNENPYILGDFNAQIIFFLHYSPTVGEKQVGERTTDNGERLLSFCRAYNIILVNTKSETAEYEYAVKVPEYNFALADNSLQNTWISLEKELQSSR